MSDVLLRSLFDFVFHFSVSSMDALLTILLFCHLLILPASSALPLCSNSRAPFTPNPPMVFCPYNGSSCCNTTDDSSLQKRFQAMNVSDPTCASLIKAVLCSKCDQYSAELFKIEPRPRTVPILCNSTVSKNSSQSSSAASDFCAKVWVTCQNVSVLNSPFAPSLQGSAGVPVNSTYSKLTDFWQSQKDFCEAFGGSSGNESVCFDGEPVSLNNTDTLPPLRGTCLEKIGNESYLNMVAHPDGSNRAFFSNQAGKIWLATVPEEGSGGVLGLDVSNSFLDLTDQVHYDTEFGLMGIAFHPDFASNGRLFASFNCDKLSWAGCSGRCSCNSDAGCDPSKLGSDNGDQPCQYQSVVAEYTVNGTLSTPSSAKTASPTEVRRIFTMGLPYTSHHGGQILFGPDGYLYFMMGDGGNRGDPFNFAQNEKSVLGKIMRLDINTVPSEAEISDLGLWGNYSIPKDNPFVGDNKFLPEIWALGFRNPWRCSFDSQRPSYFLCADVGQELYEEVNLVSRGGNYGWRVYEGLTLYVPQWAPGGNTTPGSINAIFPMMGYLHSSVNINEGSASVTGGYIYRSMTDPCMFGRYLYADLYATAMWAGTESPADSGNFSSARIPFSCALDSPIPCNLPPGSSLPALGYIFSFGEDNRKDVFLLASSGVYRVVRPSRCNYSCPLENVSAVGNTGPTSSPSSAVRLQELPTKQVHLFSFFLLLLGFSL